MARRPLLKGILTLTSASLLVRMMGMAYRVLLVRVAGSEVIGIFQMTYPLYRLCATIVSLGLPIALSRTVAESLARRDTARVRTSFKVSFSLVLLNSIAASAILLFAPASSLENSVRSPNSSGHSHDADSACVHLHVGDYPRIFSRSSVCHPSCDGPGRGAGSEDRSDSMPIPTPRRCPCRISRGHCHAGDGDR